MAFEGGKDLAPRRGQRIKRTNRLSQERRKRDGPWPHLRTWAGSAGPTCRRGDWRGGREHWHRVVSGAKISWYGRPVTARARALCSSHPPKPAPHRPDPNDGHTFPSPRQLRTHVTPGPSHFPRQPSLVALFLSLGFPPPHLAPSTRLSPALSLVRQPSFSSSTIYQDFVGKVSLLSSLIARSYTHTTTNNLHEDSSTTRSGRRIPTYTNHYDTRAILTWPGS